MHGRGGSGGGGDLLLSGLWMVRQVGGNWKGRKKV